MTRTAKSTTWEDVSLALSQPFPAHLVSWRAGSVSRDKKRAQALAYAEPRVYEDRLNEVMGSGWSCRFIAWGEQKLICELTLELQDESGTVRAVTRTSTGEFDQSDRVAQGTAAEAQAFKRACSKFGLGRYLYDLPVSWVDYDDATRRLTQTPSLPVAEAAPKAPPEPKLSEPKLSKKRAEAMQRELEKLGFGLAAQRDLAAQVLGQHPKTFADLTESEALELWNAARRTPPAVVPAAKSRAASSL